VGASQEVEHLHDIAAAVMDRVNTAPEPM